MIDLSLPQRKELAWKLNGELEKIGFRMSRLTEMEFQIEELPIRKIVPFDSASLSIKVEEYGIYFGITIKFIKILEDVTEAEEIDKVYEQDAEWTNKELPICLGEIDPHVKLTWDVEYDEYIEDTLYGHFDTVEEVITLARNLKELLDKNKKADN